MKRFVLTLLMATCVVFVSQAQRRTTGSSRDPQDVGSNSSERPSRSQEAVKPKENPSPTSNEHTPHNENPVSIVILVDNGPILTDGDVLRSGISKTIAQEEGDKPFEAVLSDNVVAPDNAGLDFSAGEIGNSGEKQTDLFFSKTGDAAEFVVGPDADIQDLGQVSFQKVESAVKGWSSTHRVVAVPGDTYVVWTWDNQYYKFRVEFLSDEQASIQWMKMDGGTRIASNVDFRDGVHHRKQSMFSR